MCDQGLILGGLGLATASSAATPAALSRSAVRVACSAAMTSGRSSAGVVTNPIISHRYGTPPIPQP
jgi:hypothetical protein